MEKRRKKFIPSVCTRCDKFLVRNKKKKIHSFLKHDDDEKTLFFENRPVIESKHDALVVHTNNCKHYKGFCNFFDPVDVIKKIFNVFNKRFVLIGKEVQIKCTFSIIDF